MKFVIQIDAPTWLKTGLTGLLGVVCIGVSGVAFSVPKNFVPNESLTAADLNADFTDLDTKVAALQASAPVWASYTPTFTSDGTTHASRAVRGSVIRYVQIGHTVCLQGHVVIGEQSSGTGGTFIKVSLPAGLPGKTGASQFGIGAVMRSGDASTLFDEGAGAIVAADTTNILLAKQTALSFTDGDARPGAGIVWAASGCYEAN